MATDAIRSWAKRRAGREGLTPIQVEVRGKTGTHMSTRWKRQGSEDPAVAAKVEHHLKSIQQKAPEALGETAAYLQNKEYAHPRSRGSDPRSTMRERLQQAKEHVRAIMAESRKLAGEGRVNWGHVGSLYHVHNSIHAAIHGEDLR